MQYFTTFFDKNYLSRGLVLIESLQKQSDKFELYLLCLDDYTFSYFEDNKSLFPEIRIVCLADIEMDSPGLLTCKANRTVIEYYFTLSPCLPLFLLNKYNLPHICSLDADIKFYSSPKILFDYLTNYSIVITPHKFSKEIKFLEKYGKNNVSFQIFKNDKSGLSCLEIWKKQCLEWCYDVLDEENNRYADQKYLDDWFVKYPGRVKILVDNVSGLAPWNLNNYKITLIDHLFYSNNEAIIFYHFHNNKFFNRRWVTNGFHNYKVKYQKTHLKLYEDYWLNVEVYAKKINITKEKFIRTEKIGKLKNILNIEKTLFLRVNKFIVIYCDFRRLNKLIRIILLKIYA